MLISFPYFGVDTFYTWVRYSHAQRQFDTEFDFLKVWLTEVRLNGRHAGACSPCHAPPLAGFSRVKKGVIPRETLINGVREWNREPSCSRFPHRGKEVPIEHV
ncbi:hypothetical protein ACQCQT_14855, partial [Ralstonia pseudosolanacearum]